MLKPVRLLLQCLFLVVRAIVIRAIVVRTVLLTVVLIPVVCQPAQAGHLPSQHYATTLNLMLYKALRFSVINQAQKFTIGQLKRRIEYMLEPYVLGKGESTGQQPAMGTHSSDRAESHKKPESRLRRLLRLLCQCIGGGGDQSSDPSMESSLLDSKQWRYFNISQFRDDLQSIREQFKRDQRPVILSFDIDGTFYRDPARRSDDEDFIDEQKALFNEFDEWLHQSVPSSVILIYNTARDYGNVDGFQHFQAQGLPAPHILIHSNGTTVLSNPQYNNTEPLQILASHVEAITTKLQTTLKNNNAAIGIAFAPQQEAITQIFITLTQGHNILYTPTSYFFSKSSEVSKLFSYIKEPCENITYGKSFSAHDPTRSLYYYDRQVNKGMSLVMVLQQLFSSLPRGFRLYTAGDDIPDLAMIFPGLLTNAFWPKSGRQYSFLEYDLNTMGVSLNEFQQLAKFWQAGIVPDTMHNMLRIVLDRTELINHPKLHRISEGSLSQIIEVIAQDIKQAPETAPETERLLQVEVH